MLPKKFKSYLCAGCQALGYCKAKAEQKEFENLYEKYRLQKIKKNIPLSDKAIKNGVPFKTDLRGANQKVGKKIQIAHDLFHENEYEQANYIYQDILQTRNDCDEAIIGAAATYYFLKKYEEAAVIAERHYEKWHSDFTNRFILSCEKKLTKANSQIKELVINKKITHALRINLFAFCETHDLSIKER